jgi:hypothetical protein
MHCRISEEEYVTAIKEEISKVVKLQEELDIDVLVHGEPEVSSLEAILLASACFKKINMISHGENLVILC